ncbi:9289_t:CDS:1, partial [Paraglomus occultum]
ERDSQYSTPPETYSNSTHEQIVTQNENVPASDNVPNSDIYQPVCTESKSLEDKKIDKFLVERHNEQISNEIRERNREKKLQAQDLSPVNTSNLAETH